MVEIGDRLDGGRVAAISDSELRYVKRGRNVVLKIPKAGLFRGDFAIFNLFALNRFKQGFEIAFPKSITPLR